LPEIWFPYGQVETLLTIQAENLASVVEPAEEAATVDLERLGGDIRKATHLFVCDSKPATLQLIAQVSEAIKSNEGLAVVPADSKVEQQLQGFKEKRGQLGRPSESERDETLYDKALLATGRKVFIATAQPDPLYGIKDCCVSACLTWVGNARRISTLATEEFLPSPYERTESYRSVEEMSSRIVDPTFVDAIPRGGKIRSVMQDAPFDTLRNGFLEAGMQPARATIVGAGGAGYDATLSDAVRVVWSAVDATRSGGDVLLLAECTDGLGSKALEMLASGRIPSTGRAPAKYVEGMEEIDYLESLKSHYDVMLLSGLPELYAKSKLGFRTAKGSEEALGKMLTKLGRSAKFNVLTRAPEARVSGS